MTNNDDDKSNDQAVCGTKATEVYHMWTSAEMYDADGHAIGTKKANYYNNKHNKQEDKENSVIRNETENWETKHVKRGYRYRVK